MNMLFFFLLAGFSVYYITQVLLYDDGPQPFQSTRRLVYHREVVEGDANMVIEETHQVGFFDRVRRLFGLYSVNGTEWRVRSERLPVWVCPKCLGFWVALFLCVVVAWLHQDITLLGWTAPLAGFNLYLVNSTDSCSD